MESTVEEKQLELRRYLSSTLITIQRDIRSGAIKTEATKHGFLLKSVYEDLEQKKRDFDGINLKSIQDEIKLSLSKNLAHFPDKETGNLFHIIGRLRSSK